jgi:nucleoside-diphosphate-sugar epimerase
MKILITGAAGNLGSRLARFLIDGPHTLRLMTHRKEMPFDVSSFPNVQVVRADLGERETLADVCRGVDCIVHFAGVLFAPRPARFLPKTNVEYVRNLAAAALGAGVKKFILISFPHVEGETTPERPATGRLDGKPGSIHARTRLAAEKSLFQACEGNAMVPVSLRCGMIYGRGVLMIEAARRLMRRRMLLVWRRPTWIHLLSLPDFLACASAAVDGAEISGVYNLGDDRPLTLQKFLDAMAEHCGFRRPLRCPRPFFYAAAWCCEAYATVFGTASPLTRDFIRIGMASYVCDTARMKKELRAELAYPALREGLSLL